MKINSHIIIKYITTLLLLVAIQLGLLVAVALIPKNLIRDNVYKSAIELTSREVFFHMNPADKSSKIDRYADSILVGIAYSYDDSEPLVSVMKSGYYHQDIANENENLLEAVSADLNPNYEYSRYWHGSIAIVRPMLILFSIKQLYINLIIITFLLAICLVFLLKKYTNFKTIFSFTTASIGISCWYIPFSLEYVWTFIIMLIASIIAIWMYEKGKRNFSLFFLIVGSFTAYFDFLTTETITLLVPVVFLLVLKEKTGELASFKEEFIILIKSCLNWGLGYIFCFLSKLSLASIILHKNCFIEAIENAQIRIGGNISSLTLFERIIGALQGNLSCLFPFSFIDNRGYAYVILCFVLLLIVYYLFKYTKTPCTFSNIMFVIALIPYLRYIILSSHSYIHYFFTYRAQFTTIMCVSLALIYGINTKKKRN